MSTHTHTHTHTHTTSTQRCTRNALIIQMPSTFCIEFRELRHYVSHGPSGPSPPKHPLEVGSQMLLDVPGRDTLRAWARNVPPAKSLLAEAPQNNQVQTRTFNMFKCKPGSDSWGKTIKHQTNNCSSMKIE